MKEKETKRCAPLPLRLGLRACVCVCRRHSFPPFMDSLRQQRIRSRREDRCSGPAKLGYDSVGVKIQKLTSFPQNECRQGAFFIAKT